MTLFKILFLLLGTQHLSAAPPRLVIKTQVNAGVVALRWTPITYALWRTWHSKGYQLERYTIQSNITLGEDSGLSTKSIKPFEDAQLKRLINTHPTAQLITSCLGDNDSPQSASELIQQIDRNEQCYIYSMLALQKDFELTMAYGLGSIDSNADPNTTYLYKLYPNGGNSIDTQYCLVNTGLPSLQPIIDNFKTFVKHNHIQMEWPAQLYQSSYFAYQIERSSDSGQTFQSLSNLPILPNISDSNLLMPAYFTDTIAHYQQWLIYRIRGINYFGQLSLPSQADTLLAFYETLVFPSSVNIVFPIPNILHITWELNTSEEANIKGFKLSICDSSEGEYTPIDSISIQASERSVDFNTSKANFYLRVNAITLNNQLNPSFQTMVQQVDSFAPDPPQIETFNGDSLGAINMQWFHSKTLDGMAYRIYKSNNRYNEFALVSPHYLSDTFYRDTLDLDMLRDSIYYKVTCIDNRYNESRGSSVIAIRIKHQIPPAPPLIYEVTNHTDKLILKWHPSFSSGVTNYYLNIHHTSTDKSIQKTLSIQDTIYNDSSLVEGESYAITLLAIARNGLASPSAKAITIQRPKNPWMPKVTLIATTQDSTKNRVDIFWQYRFDPLVKHYRIMSENNNGKTQTIGNIEGGNNYYSYYYLKPYTMKNYYIIAYFKDGRRSRL